jgi:hypothetical protein
MFKDSIILVVAALVIVLAIVVVSFGYFAQNNFNENDGLVHMDCKRVGEKNV